jgi:two-component system cell cycle sensor histidine kinase/response regulator CckA
MERLKQILHHLAAGFRAHRITKQPPGKVLVVDDDGATRQFLSIVLESAGYQTTVSADGPDALVAWQENGPFDAIVTDVMMPQMRGYELARRVRQIQPGIKVLYVTGYSDALFKEKPQLLEHEALLEKPCSPEGVLQALSRLEEPQVRHKAVWS